MIFFCSHIDLKKLYEIEKKSLKSDLLTKSYEMTKLLPMTAIIITAAIGRSIIAVMNNHFITAIVGNHCRRIATAAIIRNHCSRYNLW